MSAADKASGATPAAFSIHFAKASLLRRGAGSPRHANAGGADQVRGSANVASVHLAPAGPNTAALQVAPVVANVRSAAAVDIDRAFNPAPPAIGANGRQGGPFLPYVPASLLIAAAAAATLLSIAVRPVITPVAIRRVVTPVTVLRVVASALAWPVLVLAILVLPVIISALTRVVLVLLETPISVRPELDGLRRPGLGWRHSSRRREGATQRQQR